jgi:membrane fusion protein (multidrug efflux system)
MQGVTMAAEIPGKVIQIAFESGSAVKKGDILLRQDTSSEEAQLPGVLSQVALSRANQKRADQLFAEGIISQADHDQANANSSQSQALVDNIRATIAKKTIRAPFSGRLGIRQVNLGQVLREGDQIVTLQALDPIYVDFSLPQQQLAQVRMGLPVQLSGDALGTGVMTGRISAISPLVDSETRNVKIQATVGNRAEKLRPGMFVNVSVGLPVPPTVTRSSWLNRKKTTSRGRGGWSFASSSFAWGKNGVISSRSPPASRQAKPWSAPESSSCATASLWSSTTSWRRTSSSHQSRKTTDLP